MKWYPQLAKKYQVRLTEEERAYLDRLIHKGKVPAHQRRHAEILLKADISEVGAHWTDQQISEPPYDLIAKLLYGCACSNV